ncbi:hypothetical protein BC829DRAFT_395166 [Chytridium lagenaria]|nr:hypothetical protein BC829DRAFT_395166 [Chytridium lagenaria]
MPLSYLSNNKTCKSHRSHLKYTHRKDACQIKQHQHRRPQAQRYRKEHQRVFHHRSENARSRLFPDHLRHLLPPRFPRLCLW